MSEPQDHGKDHGSTRKLPVVEKTGDAELGQSSSASAYEPVAGTAGGGHRFWSARQIPAGVVALLLLVAAGLLLYDLVAVRADRPAMHWRRALAHRLAQQPLDSPWVLAGASVIVLLGVWLLVLAVTPGLRQVLPMRPTHDDLRAGLHRDAAATVLRDRALEVSGVRSVRVRMGRRRAEVRAVSHFRDLDEVRADLDTALADAVRDLGLHRHPALSVHVRRADRKR
ncbi:DUF6286 domain-containing protein [Streptomyces nodosus]|uniref:DUF6286 domain-containing protein n=1 Tax=Streptomyces nodosus TaxID=40318 RepID=UPI003454E47B